MKSFSAEKTISVQLEDLHTELPKFEQSFLLLVFFKQSMPFFIFAPRFGLRSTKAKVSGSRKQNTEARTAMRRKQTLYSHHILT